MRIARLLMASLISGATVALVYSAGSRAARTDSTGGIPAPEFPDLRARSWAGAPASMASLRGKVVLLNVWTFG